MPTEIDRRTFIQGTAALGGLATISSAVSAAARSGERIRLGVIGVGNRGDQLLDAFLPHKDAEIVALCDVYEPYLNAARAKVGGKARIFSDYRKLSRAERHRRGGDCHAGPLARLAVH